MQVLRAVYFKVSLGGFVLVDDWRLDGMQVPPCDLALTGGVPSADYRILAMTAGVGT